MRERERFGDIHIIHVQRNEGKRQYQSDTTAQNLLNQSITHSVCRALNVRCETECTKGRGKSCKIWQSRSIQNKHSRINKFHEIEIYLLLPTV